MEDEGLASLTDLCKIWNKVRQRNILSKPVLLLNKIIKISNILFVYSSLSQPWMVHCQSVWIIYCRLMWDSGWCDDKMLGSLHQCCQMRSYLYSAHSQISLAYLHWAFYKTIMNGYLWCQKHEDHSVVSKRKCIIMHQISFMY